MEELKKFVKSLKKFKKNSGLSGKSYLKEVISEELSKNKNIGPNELGLRLGVPKEEVETIIKNINEENDKQEVKPQKVKKDKKQLFKKNKEKVKNLLDEDDKETVKDFLLRVILFGVPLNFSMFVITKGFFSFNYYTWIGWGITFWFIKKELINILRGIVHK